MLTSLLASKFTFDGENFYSNSVAFSLFGFNVEIRYYAIAIVLGMILCVLFAIPMLKKIRLKPDILLDYMIGIIPCSIICARLWYVLNDLESFDSFIDVINITNGGLAIYGGVAGGALGIFIVGKIKKVKFSTFADIGACLLPLGQAVGRWGNFFNQEVYGMPTDAKFPFGVYISACGEWRVALFFIEGTLNFLFFIAMYVWFMKAKPKKSGYFVATYFIGYGLIRLILEPLRDQKFNLMVWGIRSQVLTSILVILAGIVVLAVCLYKSYPTAFKNLFGKIKNAFNKNYGNGSEPLDENDGNDSKSIVENDGDVAKNVDAVEKIENNN